MSSTRAEGQGSRAGLHSPPPLPAPSVKSQSLGSSRSPVGFAFCEHILDLAAGACFQLLTPHTLGAGRASQRPVSVADSRRGPRGLPGPLHGALAVP